MFGYDEIGYPPEGYPPPKDAYPPQGYPPQGYPPQAGYPPPPPPYAPQYAQPPPQQQKQSSGLMEGWYAFSLFLSLLSLSMVETRWMTLIFRCLGFTMIYTSQLGCFG